MADGPPALEEVVLSDRVAAGGDGIARQGDGRILFVEGALPGERVTVEVLEAKRDFARGRVAQVLEASPARVVPPCPHVAQGCGGCPWQHVGFPYQVGLKEAIVADALRRLGRVSHPVEWLPPAPGPEWQYRTTARLVVGPAGGLAYHRRHGPELVPVGHCLVAHPALDELITSVRGPAGAAVTLRVGVAGGQRLAVLAPAGPPRSAWSGPDGVRFVAAGQRVFLWEEAAGRRWRVSAEAFFQAGPAAATVLAGAVRQAVGDALPADGSLVDLYAGVGLLGGVVASGPGLGNPRLVAVESHRGAAADARANLASLAATVVTSEVGRWDWAGPGSADVVLADPARTGLGRPGVGAALRARPARLVLASCDPASLGRDTALLAEGGYQLRSVRVVDLFPHTTHIEAVACFEPA